MRGFQNSKINIGSSPKAMWHSNTKKYRHRSGARLLWDDLKIHITVKEEKTGILCPIRERPVGNMVNYVPGKLFKEMRRDNVPRGYFCKRCLKKGEYEDWDNPSPKMQMFMLSVTEI